MTDARGRTPECLPFCQGGLHEEGCPVLAEPAKLAHEETPDEGHTFRITVASRGAYKVVGDEHAKDAEWSDDVEPWTIEVRAYSLTEALQKAARVPLAVWAGEEPS